MITSDELMSHAARCTRFAEATKDTAVAEKFRQLARDYCDLATRPITCANASVFWCGPPDQAEKNPPWLVEGGDNLVGASTINKLGTGPMCIERWSRWRAR